MSEDLVEFYANLLAEKRSPARREKTTPKNIGIDETSFQKRHEYVAVILDKGRDVIMDI